MANYVAKVRTNYFKVKDENAWQAFCDRFEFTDIIQSNEQGEKLHGFMDESMQSGIPCVFWDEDAEGLLEIDFMKELSEQLEDGWVAIVIEIGAEKYRYLIGFACAVNSKNEAVQVTLDDIMERAEELGKHCTHPSE